MDRVAVLLAVLVCQNAVAQEPSWAETQSIPKWASEAFRKPEFTKDYLLSARLNPFLLQGDFNGDGKLDLAILISRRGSEAQGIAILFAGATHPEVIGAGHAIANGGDDLSWMNAWSVFSKGTVPRGADKAASPQLRGDALLVEKLESASAIVYWDGAAYRWYQQGD